MLLSRPVAAAAAEAAAAADAAEYVPTPRSDCPGIDGKQAHSRLHYLTNQ